MAAATGCRVSSIGIMKGPAAGSAHTNSPGGGASAPWGGWAVLHSSASASSEAATPGAIMEPELDARVRFRGRAGTITHTQLTPPNGLQGNRPAPDARRFIVVFLEPGPDGRGEEIELFESDWAEIEPVEE